MYWLILILNTATEVTKSVNVLTALRWVALVWREVKATTIQKQAGICFDVHTIVSDDEDPFNDIDDEMGMDSLISHAMGTLQHCSADEYLTGDNSLPVCVDINGNNWDENWLNSLTEGAESVDEDKDEEEDFDVDMPPPPPKIQTYKQAVVSLEDINIFLEHHGRLKLASNATSLLSELATCHQRP